MPWVTRVDRPCLAGGPRSVRELADELPISRPAVSQPLQVLQEAGLVTDRPVGTRRISQVNTAGVLALRDRLESCHRHRVRRPRDALLLLGSETTGWRSVRRTAAL